MKNQAPTETATKDALDDLNRMMAMLRQQDARAMVLSLAAFIEDMLGRLLIAYFRDCKATRELVDGFNAPLGTLSARIKAGWSFGLLTEDQYKDMEILRKIRNEFAHDWKGVSLGRNDIAAMLGQLSGYTFDGKKIESKDPQTRMLTCLGNLCIELSVFTGHRESGKWTKAVDVSYRLVTTPPTGGHYTRYVK